MRGRAHPPARLLAVVAPVSLVGITAYAVATIAFARDPGSATTIAGVGAFLIASTLAERFPVPVEGADANGVSLGFVFAVAALVLFGWAPATFIYVSAPTVVALIGLNHPSRPPLTPAPSASEGGLPAGPWRTSRGTGRFRPWRRSRLP